MADPLFEIGNHSWSHPNFRLIPKRQMHEQIVRTQAQYEILWEDLATKVQVKSIDGREMNKIPRMPLTFRFPYGTCSPQALRVTAALGLPAIQWNIVTADSCKTQTAEKNCLDHCEKVQPGCHHYHACQRQRHPYGPGLGTLCSKLAESGISIRYRQ